MRLLLQMEKRSVLTENITLMREINELRRDLKVTISQRDRARFLLAENGYNEEGQKVRVCGYAESKRNTPLALQLKQSNRATEHRWEFPT